MTDTEVQTQNTEKIKVFVYKHKLDKCLEILQELSLYCCGAKKVSGPIIADFIDDVIEDISAVRAHIQLMEYDYD